MIRCKDPKTGKEAITTNDRRPDKPRGSAITTNDLDRNRKPIKKGGHDEKS